MKISLPAIKIKCDIKKIRSFFCIFFFANFWGRYIENNWICIQILLYFNVYELHCKMKKSSQNFIRSQWKKECAEFEIGFVVVFYWMNPRFTSLWIEICEKIPWSFIEGASEIVFITKRFIAKVLQKSMDNFWPLSQSEKPLFTTLKKFHRHTNIFRKKKIRNF